MKKEQKRHGDLLLERVETLPAGATLVSQGDRIILARGETTGHAHVITAPHIEEWQTAGGERFVKLESAGVLTHEEHGPQTFAPGVWRVISQQETDLSGEWRQVRD